MKLIIYLVIFFISIQIACSATIHGTIYNLDLEKVDNVVVEVNSIPQQRIISQNSSYSFELNPGIYKISARYINHLIYYIEEGVEIKESGTYVLDLFLFPSFEQENELLIDTNITVEDDFSGKDSFNYFYLIIILILFVLIFLIFKFPKKKKGIQKPEINKKEFETGKNQIVKDIEEDNSIQDSKEEKEDLNNVLEIIKNSGGRTTQKEIRKQIPLSEAKVSLMIAELESKGKIRKIKKGRGNILILNE